MDIARDTKPQPGESLAPAHRDYSRLQRGQLEQLHEQGDKRASVRLAAAMLADRECDPHLAISWLQLLLEVNDSAVVARAKAALADAFVHRRIGLSSAREARDFFMDAAMGGVGAGFHGLGRWYEGAGPAFGTATPDLELAAHLYEEGVRARSSGCATALARLHLSGRLRKADKEVGRRLLLSAANSGDTAARSELARLDRRIGSGLHGGRQLANA